MADTRLVIDAKGILAFDPNAQLMDCSHVEKSFIWIGEPDVCRPGTYCVWKILQFCSQKKGTIAMKTWKHFYDNAPKVIGGLLLLTPFIFGIVTMSTPFWNTWLLGIVVGVVAVFLTFLWWGIPRNKPTEGMTVLVGLVLCISPWVLNENRSFAGIGVCSLLGVLLVITAASETWVRLNGFVDRAKGFASISNAPYRQRQINRDEAA